MRKYLSARFSSTSATEHGTIRSVSLLERIESVLEVKQWSGIEWARQAKLKEKSHVNTIIGRLRKNPDATVDVQTLAKMADAAGVSLDWLALGRGTPDGAFVQIDEDPRYPSRAVAVAVATIAGWSADGIRRVRAMDHFAADPGVEVWVGLLRTESGGTKPPLARGKRSQVRKRG